MSLSTIPDAIKDFSAGKFVIVVDDEDRENEGDLVIAAEKITSENINFMIKKGGGLICVPMLKERLDELNLPLMVDQSRNDELTQCKFTLSVDFKNGTSGISAQDRALTISKLIDPSTKPADLSRPGHIFPLAYEEGGVCKRNGHTEATVDLCKLSNLYPAGVLCEILREDGKCARMDDLKIFAQEYDLKIISIADLIAYLDA